jgi:hypothetical protein
MITITTSNSRRVKPDAFLNFVINMDGLPAADVNLCGVGRSEVECFSASLWEAPPGLLLAGDPSDPRDNASSWT